MLFVWHLATDVYSGVRAITASQCQQLESQFAVKKSTTIEFYWLEIQFQRASRYMLTLTELACVQLYC